MAPLLAATSASACLSISAGPASALSRSPCATHAPGLSWRSSQLTSGSRQKLLRQHAGARAAPGESGGVLAPVRRVRSPVAEQFVEKEGEGKEGEGDSSGTPLKTILQSAQEARDGKGPEGKGSPTNTILRARREHPQGTHQLSIGADRTEHGPDHDRLLTECANAVRLLAVDSVNNIKAGHPGSAMGLAHLGVLLFSEFLRFNPANPSWPNRDRFVMSNGHACLLQYILLHLTGYDLQIEDLKQLCKLGSRTPGHPENHVTQGIEVVTGPLGQGFANAVGLAVAESVQAADFNTPEIPVIDHYTYVIFGDGCAMEGVTNEAGSLAGHWGLGKLIAFYDSNDVTIDGHTDITFTEDVMGRYAALGWHTQRVSWEQYGDFEVLRKAIQAAQQETGRPSVIQLDTCIGYGSPAKEGTPSAHHGPFGEEEAHKIRERFGRDPQEAPFTVPEAVYTHMRQAVERGAQQEGAWKQRVEQYAQRYPDRFLDLHTRLSQELPRDWEDHVPTWTGEEKPDATRGYSERCLNELAAGIPAFLGGSADLGSSNKTLLKGEGDYGRDNRRGRNLRYGVREHAMGAISNGMALHGTGLVPFASTFLIFSDYMRPAVRLAALSGAGVIFVFTHDSIGLGEDGPTHQPVEHLPSLRAMPNLVVLRPGDGQETSGAYRVAMQRRNAPTALVFSRQKLTGHLKGSSQEAVAKGAYVLCQHSAGKGAVGGGVQGGEGNGVEGEGVEVLLLSSGAEVVLCQEAAEKLQEKGISSRVVSMVSWELFRAQPQEYRDSVIPPKASLRLAVEAASPMGWAEWLGPHGETLCVNRFGSSGNYLDVFKAYGFTVENVVERCEEMVKRWTFL